MGIMAEVAHFLSSSSSSTQRAPNSLKLLLDPSNATVCEREEEIVLQLQDRNERVIRTGNDGIKTTELNCVSKAKRRKGQCNG